MISWTKELWYVDILQTVKRKINELAWNVLRQVILHVKQNIDQKMQSKNLYIINPFILSSKYYISLSVCATYYKDKHEPDYHKSLDKD
jgi:hypothetical protein